MLTPRDKFVIALKYEVERRGRGFQARMADELQIPRNRFNDYLKNRINCPEEIRERCATYLGLRYEEMLKKGILLAGGSADGDTAEAVSPVCPPGWPPIPPDILEAVRDKRIQEVVRCLAREFKERVGG